MQSKGNAPTAAQKRWREAIRTKAQEVEGGNLEIHHPIGASAKIKGVGNIGHWWVIPVDAQSHKDIHAGKFGSMRKSVEKEIFESVLNVMSGDPDFPPQDAIDAIRDYHR